MLMLTEEMVQSLVVTLADGSQAFYIGQYQIGGEGVEVKSINISAPHYIDGVCLAREMWCGLMPRERKSGKR